MISKSRLKELTPPTRERRHARGPGATRRGATPGRSAPGLPRRPCGRRGPGTVWLPFVQTSACRKARSALLFGFTLTLKGSTRFAGEPGGSPAKAGSVALSRFACCRKDDRAVPRFAPPARTPARRGGGRYSPASRPLLPYPSTCQRAAQTRLHSYAARRTKFERARYFPGGRRPPPGPATPCRSSGCDPRDDRPCRPTPSREEGY
ncbi:MAG: hypothetical protein JWO31_3355 [Phycisphaerales bacterium]|nr:hypothetical protein [Phycisphaerales bacterium]